MSEHQINRWTKHMEIQGVGVVRTKKGLLLRLPDKSTTMIHFTQSDVKAELNVKARLRRAGVNHPDDQRETDLPAYITTGTVTQPTKDRFLAWLRKHDFPAEVYAKDLVKDLKMDPGQANRVLYHSGFIAEKALTKRGRAWRTPEALLEQASRDEQDLTVAETVIPDDARDLIGGDPTAADDAAAEHEEAIESEVPDDGQPDYAAEGFQPGELVGNGERVPVSRGTAEEAEALYNQMPAFEPEKESFPEPVEELDYIDTRDSWVPDMETLLGAPLARMVRDRLEVLTAVGIDFEIRVWRKP